jgi:hypothetical protein
MIAIEKLFDDGENVLSRNPDVTFLHSLFACFVYSSSEQTASKYRAKVKRRARANRATQEKEALLSVRWSRLRAFS